MTELLIKELENMGKHPTVRLPADRETWKQAAAMLRKQRDELLKALKRLMNNLDGEIKNATDEELASALSEPECPEDIKEELACLIECRAAIAKAESGAA